MYSRKLILEFAPNHIFQGGKRGKQYKYSVVTQRVLILEFAARQLYSRKKGGGREKGAT